MGYRLEIRKIENKSLFYGTKLFGYVQDPEELKSIKYLIKKEFIEDPYIFDYDGEVPICMKIKDFRTFAKLYDEDLKEYNNADYCFLEDAEIKAILELKDTDEIVLSWG